MKFFKLSELAILLAVILIALALHGCAVTPKPTVREATPAEVAAMLKVMGIEGAPDAISYTRYDTAEAAAIAGLKLIADKHNGVYEYGGAIGKTADGKYEIADPSTNFAGDNVEIRGNGLPSDAEQVSSYHTHPCLPQHDCEFFSPQDLLAVIFAHQESAFMGDWCTGHVHEFKRGDQPDTENVHGVWLTKGRIIGTFTTPHAMLVP